MNVLLQSTKKVLQFNKRNSCESFGGRSRIKSDSDDKRSVSSCHEFHYRYEKQANQTTDAVSEFGNLSLGASKSVPDNSSLNHESEVSASLPDLFTIQSKSAQATNQNISTYDGEKPADRSDSNATVLCNSQQFSDCTSMITAEQSMIKDEESCKGSLTNLVIVEGDDVYSMHKDSLVDSSHTLAAVCADDTLLSDRDSIDTIKSSQSLPPADITVVTEADSAPRTKPSPSSSQGLQICLNTATLPPPTATTTVTDDFSCRIPTSGQRLSTVMEDLPLVYLPSLRKLVCTSAPESSNTDSIAVAPVNNSDRDQTPLAVSEPSSPALAVARIKAVEDGAGDFRENQTDEQHCSIFSAEHSLPIGLLPRTNSDSFSISSISSNFSSIASELPDGKSDESSYISLHSRDSLDRLKNTSADSGIDEKGLTSKQKHRGFGGSIRSLLRRVKSNNSDAAANAEQTGPNAGTHRHLQSQQQHITAPSLASRLFSRGNTNTTSRPAPQHLAASPQLGMQTSLSNGSICSRDADQLSVCSITSTGSGKIRSGDVEVASTHGLILHDRPPGLPAKTAEEEESHRQQYERILEAVKRKEAQVAKLKSKKELEQQRHTEQMAAIVQTWKTKIIPEWDTMKNSKRTSELWWKGLPPPVRGKVWSLAIGNHLNITEDLYSACICKAKDIIKLLDECREEVHSNMQRHSDSTVSRLVSVDMIRLDVSRTFPQLCIFQKGGPYYEHLHNLLGAYACYRPDVGYVQGMSFLAAVLLINLEPAEAFTAFANLLDMPCFAAFYSMDEKEMAPYFGVYKNLLKLNAPKLYAHFEAQEFTSNLYLIDWVLTLYSKSLPLDIACRIWDIFFRDGEEFIFKAAIGMLQMLEDTLLKMEFSVLAEYITRLSSETIDPCKLFQHIDAVHLHFNKVTFHQYVAESALSSLPSQEIVNAI